MDRRFESRPSIPGSTRRDACSRDKCWEDVKASWEVPRRMLELRVRSVARRGAGRPGGFQIGFNTLVKLLGGRGHHIPAPTLEGCRATFQAVFFLSFLSRLAGPACGCRSSGWALVLLARLSLALVGGVVVSFVSLSEGAVPRTGFSAGIPLFSSGTSVPCTRSPRVGGTFCLEQRDGSDGWQSPVPRGDILGGVLEYLTCQPSLYCPADRSRTP